MTTARDTDNRCTDDMIVYYEARIEALVNRVHELEALQSESDKPMESPKD